LRAALEVVGLWVLKYIGLKLSLTLIEYDWRSKAFLQCQKL